MKSTSGNPLVDGIKTTYYESGSDEPSVVDWPGEPGEIILLFCLQGKLNIRVNSLGEYQELCDNQHTMCYFPETAPKIHFSELPVRWFSVQFSAKAFLSLSDSTNPAVKQFVGQLKSDNPALFLPSPPAMDWAMHSCIQSLINCPYRDSLKRMFVLSKAVELLVLQIESSGRAAGRPVTYVKKEYDRERILFARDYLIRHMENPPSLSELSRLAGINEFKLKNGFKEVFNQPVFAWLADFRLETARNELMKKSRTITDIAFDLGYSSPQHFSSAFKKKYGVSPREIA